MQRAVSLFDTNADTPGRPTCVDCRFYRIKGQKCQRYPPVVVYDVASLNFSQAFPFAAPDGWCGEFSSRLEEIDQPTPKEVD